MLTQHTKGCPQACDRTVQRKCWMLLSCQTRCTRLGRSHGCDPGCVRWHFKPQCLRWCAPSIFRQDCTDVKGPRYLLIHLVPSVLRWPLQFGFKKLPMTDTPALLNLLDTPRLLHYLQSLFPKCGGIWHTGQTTKDGSVGYWTMPPLCPLDMALFTSLFTLLLK